MSTTALFSSLGTEATGRLVALLRLQLSWVAQPLVRPAEVAAYLPQQAPFALVDTLYHSQPGAAWAGLWVSPDHLMVHHGYLSEAGTLESMAQAVALQAGYEARQRAAPPRVGFIAALKEAHLHALPPVGRTLVTHVETLLQALDVLVVKTTSGYDNTLVAQCEMRLFLEPEAETPAAPANDHYSATSTPIEYAHC